MKLISPIKIIRNQKWDDAGESLKTNTKITFRNPIIAHNPLALASTLRELMRDISVKDNEYYELKEQYEQACRERDQAKNNSDYNYKLYRQECQNRNEEAKKHNTEIDNVSNAINNFAHKSDWFIGSHDAGNRHYHEFLSFRPRLIDSRIDNSRYGGRRDKLADTDTISRVCNNINLEGWNYDGKTGYFTLEGTLNIYNWISIRDTINKTQTLLQAFLDDMIHAEQIANALQSATGDNE